mmetsp:Transcript_14786/g.31917  ORF Transcript_14786/g.31917 Transcript_14786/m.31917 type:complete len:814 (-) Transcript_14786:54-2495(-)
MAAAAVQLRRALKELLVRTRPPQGRISRPQVRPPQPVPGRSEPKLGIPSSRPDEWGFLHDVDGPESSHLLKEEAAAIQGFFQDTEDFQRRVQTEAAYLLNPEGEAPPEASGPWQHFERMTEDGFVVYCRAPRTGGAVEVMLDTGKLADESESGFADVPACKVSPDHQILAYVVDMVGDESYELRLRTLGAACKEWDVRIPGVRNIAFLGAGDERNGVRLLAVHSDEQTKRARSIYYHHIGLDGPRAEPLLIWDERNDAAYLEVFNTKNQEWVLLSSNTKDTSEVRAVASKDVDIAYQSGGSTSSTSFSSSGVRRKAGPSKPVDAEAKMAPALEQLLLLEPIEGVEYFVEHQAGYFYVISNHERPDFIVYRLAEEDAALGGSGWDKLVPFFTPPGGMHVTDADVLERHLVLYGHDAAEPRVCVVSMTDPSKKNYLVDLPSPMGSVEPGVNAESNAESIRFTFRTPLEPASTYEVHLDSGNVSLIRRREWSQHGPGPENFECERVEYCARDGVRVPLTMVRPKRSIGGGHPRPCLVHVYGAYGQSLVPDFRPEHVVLLRQGWVIAWAHVRGGGERGKLWHDAGRRLNKVQSVLDLADALKFLLARGIAVPGALCCKGSSAGGLTLGALLNSSEASSLVSAAILEVPFLDLLTGMSDPSLPLTVHEFAEWGDPRESDHAANLQTLSPYEGIDSHPYPKLYLTAARADARVPLWMASKYAARLRARSSRYLEGPLESTSAAATSSCTRASGGRRRRKTLPAAEPDDLEKAKQDDDLPFVLLRCSDAGHGGAADWHGQSEEFSRQITFLNKAVGQLPQ